MAINPKYRILIDLRVNNPNMSLDDMAIEVSMILEEPVRTREYIRQLLTELNLSTRSTDWVAQRDPNRPMPMPTCQKCGKTIPLEIKPGLSRVKLRAEYVQQTRKKYCGSECRRQPNVTFSCAWCEASVTLSGPQFKARRARSHTMCCSHLCSQHLKWNMVGRQWGFPKGKMF